jgi:ectoine hydroxylase-related dioxygenase (phytanoyl-CoA dioxygenase family)
MDSLYNKYNIKNVLMEPGDILFFNHLLAHSSASNLTNLERRSIVLQATHLFEKDESVFEKFNNFRVQFVVDNLSKIINKLKNQDFYKDFNKKDNNEI